MMRPVRAGGGAAAQWWRQSSRAGSRVRVRSLTQIKLGDVALPFEEAGHLERLKPHNSLLASPQLLREALDRDGYLYIKGLHDRQEVLDARDVVLEHFAAEPGVLDPTFPRAQGVLEQGCGVGCVPFLEGRNPVTHHQKLLRVLEGPRPHRFFATLFGEPARTFDYKWLRGVHRQAFTGAHVDNVYMSRGSPRLLTCWTPLMDIDLPLGTLAVLEGSHRLPAYQQVQATYGSLDVEAAGLDGTGWYSTNPLELSRQFGGIWKTDEFQAGDALVFTMRTFHMSSCNQTDRVRVSCDTRWQPASEPVDPRYAGQAVGHGAAKFGLHNSDKTKATAPRGVTMPELKRQWGLEWHPV